ncbi:chemotaxis protein CheR [Mariprofundus sp. EBB-1]|uniref:chemotaxis protein CheB n=1 Tax=Mariprofundus sp. EBB-1 TaxID=2650971 RepID=UPI000EF2591F|nr:chemotaxis protein CheB [Mariprofundus sp. EBB-1]RLL56003.1 chemotaxis protein CheR [Mariprofundus sp. EBB-1]
MVQDRGKATAGKASVKKSIAKKKSNTVPHIDGGSAAFPIVGLGASAGGLEALQIFFDAMPDTSPAAFIIVAHLAPKHVSLMPELIQRHTKMPVEQIQDGTRVESGHVYIIPPNYNLCLLNGTLELMLLPEKRGALLPIDNFFKSLAQDQGANAVAIILSGTGSDGTIGIRAIKDECGMCMVQTEASAKYDGMPHCAIASNRADYVLSPDEMPAQLHKLFKYKYSKANIVPERLIQHPPDALQKIFVILRSRTNHDFSQYKKNTLCRRIERRMNVHHLGDIFDYVRYLQESDREADILFDELLIGVTNMFRDPDAFYSLANYGLIEMMKQKPEGYTFRVWVAGCSTGEEAYSIAILILECMEKLKCDFQVQVFATDIDEKAITIARRGVYASTIAKDVNDKRLKRYFIKLDDGQYQVKKMVREILVFAPQNVIKDPPFTKLDLISCRNLLIYLGSELQKKLLPVFHYSLKPEGILFLGSSETIGQQNIDYFSVVDKKWKIFKALPFKMTTTPILNFPGAPIALGEQELTVSDKVQKIEEISAFQLVEAILQQSDAPPCVIIGVDNNITYIHGKTGRFLEPSQGQVTVNLLAMLRPGLKKAFSEAIQQVGMHNQDVVCKGLQVEHSGGYINVDMTVRPIREPMAMHSMTMVVFEEVSEKGADHQPKRVKVRSKPKTVEELEQDLRFTKEHLQSTIEELETSNEELKSINEELQSTNEELQSTNEELETSKEELQSLNEESVTVNSELQGRIEDLSASNDDMKNLLDSTEIAIVFLDIDLCVRRFTPAVSALIPLAASDAGRPIKHFASNLLYEDLTQDAEKVLNDLSVINKDVVSKCGSEYHMQMRPYRTVNNVIDGVVVTFDNISASKEAEKRAIRAKLYAESILNTVRQSLLVLDKDLRVVSANPLFYKYFSAKRKDTIGHVIYDLGNGQWNIPKLRELLDEVLNKNSVFDDYEVEYEFEAIGKHKMILNARKVIGFDSDSDSDELILLAIENGSKVE